MAEITGNPADMAGFFDITGSAKTLGGAVVELFPADAQRVSLIVSATGGILWLYPGGAQSGNGLIAVQAGSLPLQLTFKDHGALVGLKWDVQDAGPPAATFVDAVAVSYRPPERS